MKQLKLSRKKLNRTSLHGKADATRYGCYTTRAVRRVCVFSKMNLKICFQFFYFRVIFLLWSRFSSLSFQFETFWVSFLNLAGSKLLKPLCFYFFLIIHWHMWMWIQQPETYSNSKMHWYQILCTSDKNCWRNSRCHMYLTNVITSRQNIDPSVFRKLKSIGKKEKKLYLIEFHIFPPL